VEAVQDVIWSGRPDLRRPVMVCAFRGWNDAGEAASAAVSFIRESVDSQDVASINPEEFFDFTAVRPTIRLTEGNTREIDWPDGTISAAYVPGAESDLVVLEATEPSLRWRRYTENVMSVARELGVRKVITLGALLADVPHSRPVAVTGLSSDSGVVEKLGFQRTSYEGPTGIVGVLHHACIQAGVESASLWASVPHYVAAAPNPKVALARVRGFVCVAGVVEDAGELESAADDYERQVSAAVASDPEVKAFVERLETAMDEEQAEEPDEGSLPSADTIARDFQRFLRQRGPDDEPGPS
jgi:predicted ATP-grasp superfamily ATP-dependent carboligase